MEIHNNELSRILDKIKDTIDKTSVTKSMDRHTLLQSLIETMIEGNLDVMGVHAETILSNQIRNIDNIIEMPEWEYPNEPYEIYTLSQALSNNPSVIVRLSYERVSKALYNPLTYRCSKPSFMDLFFMEKPQEYLSGKGEIRETVEDTFVSKELKQVVTFVEGSNTLDEEGLDNPIEISDKEVVEEE
jgi:hypothetical protein